MKAGTTNSAHTYVQELILCGIMLSQNGDAKRIKELLTPELLQVSGSIGPVKLVRAINEGNAESVWDWLATVGVFRIEEERAVDSVVRQYLSNRKVKLEKVLKHVNEGIRKESKRAESKLEKKEKAK